MTLQQPPGFAWFHIYDNQTCATSVPTISDTLVCDDKNTVFGIYYHIIWLGSRHNRSFGQIINPFQLIGYGIPTYYFWRNRISLPHIEHPDNAVFIVAN